MKKKLVTFFSLIVAVMMLLSTGLLAACGGGNNSGDTCDHVDQNGDDICDLCGDPMGSEPDKPDKPDNPDNPGDVEEGEIRVVFHYNRALGYSGCDIWIWWSDVAGRGYTLTNTDSYGAYVIIDIPAETESVGFIVRTGCSDPGGTDWGTATKDGTQDDRTVPVTDRFIKNNQIDVYLKANDAKNYLSNDGGKTLEEMKIISLADMASFTQVKYVVSPAGDITKDMISIKTDEGKTVAVSSLANDSRLSGTITLGENLDPTEAYKLSIEGYGDSPIVPNSWFNDPSFFNNYSYSGKLGVELTTTKAIFRLWAPTSKSVTLNIYDTGTQGEGTAKTYPLTGGGQAEKGLWTKELDRSEVENKYYTYTVVNSLGTNEVVDPYAVSVGLNGKRGMVLDIANTNPETGFDHTNFLPETAKNGGKFNYTDANIWEIHVRDFSNMNSAQKAEYRGKYMAFTETNLTNANGVPVGVKYLKQLGITHVHLLPSFDYATVEEQASAAFNWGYDPLNYNAPEGSYSTDPAHGEVRVKEFKAMVQALHDEGIGVIMDVVYNHTSGLDSNFQKIVPYYYYRFQGNGKPYSGSGCGNETASDRTMFRKFMIDSVEHWLNDYNVDGFRFDLMGLHDTTTMQQIERAVHAINPNALIYGEGWTGGTSGLASSNQSVLSKLRTVNSSVGGVSGNHSNGVSMFNDVIRDAIKGSTNGTDTGYATGAKDDSGTIKNILFGLNGSVQNSTLGTRSSGWQAYDPTNVINYASAHDNLSLWDKIQSAYGKGTNALSIKRNRLAASIVQLALGVPFMQAGEEMLRTKTNSNGTFNENSYNAPDSVNNLKWDTLTTSSEQYKMMQYYSGLIAFRKAHAVVRSATSEGILSKNGSIPVAQGSLIQYQMKSGSDTIYVIFNAGLQEGTAHLPAGNWGLYINGDTGVAGTTRIGSSVSGNTDVKIPPISCYVYVLNG